jgi:hypothetical protein
MGSRSGVTHELSLAVDLDVDDSGVIRRSQAGGGARRGRTEVRVQALLARLDRGRGGGPLPGRRTGGRRARASVRLRSKHTASASTSGCVREFVPCNEVNRLVFGIGDNPSPYGGCATSYSHRRARPGRQEQEESVKFSSALVLRSPRLCPCPSRPAPRRSARTLTQTRRSLEDMQVGGGERGAVRSPRAATSRSPPSPRCIPQRTSHGCISAH